MKNPMERLQRNPDLKDSSSRNNEKDMNIKLEDVSIFKKKDFYARLAVHPEADSEDVTKAYRRKSMQYHPDRTEGNQDLERNYVEIMQLVNEAYETLSNPDKRKKYDSELSQKPISSSPQNGTEASGPRVESQIKLFSNACNSLLSTMGIQNGMSKILDVMQRYVREGIPQARLNQVILPSVQKYYITFAEAKLTKENVSSMFSMAAPERLEIISIVDEFQRYVPSQDIKPLFRKLLKKEMILDYYKKYLLSVKRDERFLAIRRSREYILKLSDTIFDSELKTIEDQVRIK